MLKTVSHHSELLFVVNETAHCNSKFKNRGMDGLIHMGLTQWHADLGVKQETAWDMQACEPSRR